MNVRSRLHMCSHMTMNVRSGLHMCMNMTMNGRPRLQTCDQDYRTSHFSEFDVFPGLPSTPESIDVSFYLDNMKITNFHVPPNFSNVPFFGLSVFSRTPRCPRIFRMSHSSQISRFSGILRYPRIFQMSHLKLDSFEVLSISPPETYMVSGLWDTWFLESRPDVRNLGQTFEILAGRFKSWLEGLKSWPDIWKNENGKLECGAHKRDSRISR